MAEALVHTVSCFVAPLDQRCLVNANVTFNVHRGLPWLPEAVLEQILAGLLPGIPLLQLAPRQFAVALPSSGHVTQRGLPSQAQQLSGVVEVLNGQEPAICRDDKRMVLGRVWFRVG